MKDIRFWFAIAGIFVFMVFASLLLDRVAPARAGVAYYGSWQKVAVLPLEGKGTARIVMCDGDKLVVYDLVNATTSTGCYISYKTEQKLPEQPRTPLPPVIEPSPRVEEN